MVRGTKYDVKIIQLDGEWSKERGELLLSLNLMSHFLYNLCVTFCYKLILMSFQKWKIGMVSQLQILTNNKEW